MSDYQRTFIIVFKRAEKKRWWMNFIDERFAHCFLITQLSGQGSIVIDPSEGGMGLYQCSRDAREMAFEAVQKGFTVASYTACGSDMRKPRVKFFRTCVGICKDFLGIRKWWIITPKQLYREIAR